MNSYKILEELYANGNNISLYLKNNTKYTLSEQDIIEISYDLQTGSYTKAMDKLNIASYKKKYTQELSNYILSLCSPNTILEAGIGEGTTLCGVLNNLPKNIQSFGFDISWSRISYAKKWLIKNKHNNVNLCTGDLLNIPFVNNSIDIVYTSHSIEPNGGKEKKILKELYRVTKKYLILLEPSYELSNQEAKDRMDLHGYCKNLKNTCLSLGYKIIRHELFQHIINPLNPTAITIIEKTSSKENNKSKDYYACPRFKTPIKIIKGSYFSHEALSVYPIIDNIPCLKIENSILASKFCE